MIKFAQEFKTLNYLIKKSDSILLFAHNRPDGDTVGSVLVLKYYIENLGKKSTLGCFDPFPSFLEDIFPEKFELPSNLNLKDFDLIIACDAVERGFQKILPKVKDEKIVALIDHHPYVSIKADINIIDSKFSSVCEILYNFFVTNNIKIDKKTATYLMLGISYDTGNFQHASTSSRSIKIASDLMNKGASLDKIAKAIFANKKITTLKLWGRAFEKAKINQENGMIISVLTQKDIEECKANTDDIAQVAQILNTVPGTKFSLILSERDENIIKGSLRSEEYKNIDVSQIAARFGGGGHRLASGFEIKGKIKETENGWKIV